MGYFTNTSLSYVKRGHSGSTDTYVAWRVVSSATQQRYNLFADHDSIILDARVGITIHKGGFMSVGLGIDEEVLKWAEMELPDTEPNRAKVSELEGRGIKTHFKFIQKNSPRQ